MSLRAVPRLETHEGYVFVSSTPTSVAARTFGDARLHDEIEQQHPAA